MKKYYWKNPQKIEYSWTYSYLSKGGKLTLIHSILSSSKPLLASANSLKKSWRNFLWKNHDNDKLTHLLRWNKVIPSKENGGLGIFKVANTNFSLLNKWLWRFSVQNNPLLKRIILAKYSQSFIREFLAIAKYSSMKAPRRNIYQMCIVVQWRKSLFLERHLEWY